MKIKCPQCSATNEVQKFCGNCGSVLLVNGTELAHNTNPDTNDLKLKPTKKRGRWLKGIGIFLLIYIFGGIVIDVFALRTGLDGRYASLISFVAGIIIAWYYIATTGEIEIDETIIK